ncbi:tRNA pseudouridine synthase A [Psychroflexus aestuariivivens]|uniref:tRNA pseudouridine synthase A n=1 Tax=Psychroflexus aestuariivivens TaxID=1795040 RepID=UPI000FDCAAA3|nr:tRNA pseudouridine synthase A [Psychroflexus aestuariivivens]
MQYKRFYYLIKLQYLGFRYHGWQKQPDVLTVEHMLNKTLNYVLEGKRFKVIAAGRTDAMVSVNQTYAELFIYEDALEIDSFFPEFNKNLPPDIRALEIEETSADFNIIQHPKLKEYLYFFTIKEKMHPFCAPFMVNIQEDLDIELMMIGAKYFEGEHDFYSFTFRPNSGTITDGEIVSCELKENDIYTANFFPVQSFVLRVVGEGFKRQQIRLMMGALIDLGRHKIDLDFLKQTINGKNRIKLEHIAQASGLILNKVEL